jgi:hypothetical protein
VGYTLGAVPLALAAVSCSGSSANIGGDTNCGAGTGNACIVADAASDTTSQTSSDAAGPTDATTSDQQAGDSGPLADASHDADAEPPPDACPVENSSLYLELDCDPACQKHGSEPQCSQVTCGPSVNMTLSLPVQASVIRTPQAPGMDPNCATQCGPGTLTYGMGFSVPYKSSAPQGWVARVSPPWQIVTNPTTPFCHDGPYVVGPAQCVRVGANGVNETMFLVTSDPSAPARNVTLTMFNGSNGCP